MISFKESNRLTYRIITLIIAVFIMGACLPPPKSSTQTSSSSPTEPLKKPEPKLPKEPDSNKKTPQKVPESPEVSDYPDGAAWRSLFNNNPIVNFLIPTVLSTPTNYYLKRAPAATILGDYNQKPFNCLMAVHFTHHFEKNLPTELLAELEKRQLRNNTSVDINWVLQPLSNLGGNSQGTVNNITYLKAHGWADSDAPEKFSGDRVKRNFLYGIFDADIDISHEVKLSTMTPFLIWTHSATGPMVGYGQYSPQTAAIKLPSAKPDSMAFWSLVIDENPPNNARKAVATLHWLISEGDIESFYDESFDISGVKSKFKLIGDYISMLQTTSSFKNTSLVKKLTALIKP